ncbi:MAG: hypothetical protein MUP67_13000 [Acidimicrobiia bacterium]|nr:hypothetical protein [Acidimicrobiia bacterium]
MSAPRTIGVGDVVPPVEIEMANGSTVELGSFLQQTLVVVAIRYYG